MSNTSNTERKKFTTITVDESVHRRLQQFGHVPMSFNQVLSMVLDEYVRLKEEKEGKQQQVEEATIIA